MEIVPGPDSESRLQAKMAVLPGMFCLCFLQNKPDMSKKAGTCRL